ncbi:hypothetical protein [Saccharopolyspora taberi]|uniref:Excreted virulence factor EspC, type VII ESX diderm n=1 Tax=Saccharopolyspora taberi TaxID=60895 RepID=A0ABN3VJN4_9PSEU
MGYRANPDALDGAGAKAEAAGSQAGRVDLERPAADIGRAMPGGATEDTAARVSRSWADALEKWSREAERHGASLRAAADDYRATDRSNADQLARTGAR